MQGEGLQEEVVLLRHQDRMIRDVRWVEDRNNPQEKWLAIRQVLIDVEPGGSKVKEIRLSSKEIAILIAFIARGQDA